MLPGWFGEGDGNAPGSPSQLNSISSGLRFKYEPPSYFIIGTAIQFGFSV